MYCKYVIKKNPFDELKKKFEKLFPAITADYYNKKANVHWCTSVIN